MFGLFARVVSGDAAVNVDVVLTLPLSLAVLYWLHCI